jgi:hypothetical protein
MKLAKVPSKTMMTRDHIRGQINRDQSRAAMIKEKSKKNIIKK